jgi:hypothetical protein
LDQAIEQLKERASAKTQRLSRDRRKNKNSIIQIKCLEETARNFTTHQTHKYQCKEGTTQRGHRELLESNIWGKVTA